MAKFPPGRQRSASLSALRAAQEQNQGFLTADLMDAVAEYLKLPPVQVYEVARFYSMLETHPCGRHHGGPCSIRHPQNPNFQRAAIASDQ